MKKNKKFEDNFSELEEIVNSLEKGNFPLDESIVLFETGVKLVGECQKQLEQAERKVELLTKDNDKIITNDFEEPF